MLTRFPFQDAGQWKWIFILTSCVYLAGCTFYWFFASGVVQPWAKPKNDNRENTELDKVKDFPL